VEEELNDLVPGYVNRLSGTNRYGTSRAVANRVIDILGTTYSGMACVATGNRLPRRPCRRAACGWAGVADPSRAPATGDVYLPADTSEVAVFGGEAAGAAVRGSMALAADLGEDMVTRVGGTPAMRPQLL